MKKFTVFLITVCLVSSIMVIGEQKTERANVPWWNPAYGKRVQVNVSNPTLSDYNQQLVAVYLNTTQISYDSILPSGEDIAVVDANGQVMNYTVISWTPAKCEIAVEMSIPAGGTVPVWVYYNSTAPVSIPLKNNTNYISEQWSNASDLSAWQLHTPNGTFAIEQYSPKLSFLNQTIVTNANSSISYSIALLNVSKDLNRLAWEVNNASLPENSFVSLNLNFSDGSVLRYISLSAGNFTDADLLNGSVFVYYKNLTGTAVQHEGIEFERFEVSNISADVQSEGISANLTALSLEVATTDNSTNSYSIFWNLLAGCVEPSTVLLSYGVEENITGPILTIFAPEDGITTAGEVLNFAGSYAGVYSNVSQINIISDTTTQATLLPEGLWFAPVNISTYSPGPHQFEVQALDETGVSASIFLNITISSAQKPYISIAYPANNTKVNGTENCTGALANATGVNLRVNNFTWQSASLNSSAWWASYNFSQHPYGKYILIVKASTSTDIVTYSIAIVNHSPAPEILNFNVLPTTQISDNDTFSAWANITSSIAFSAHLQYSLSSNFIPATEISMSHIAGAYYAQVSQKFDTLTTIYFRIKVVDIDNYTKYSGILQRTVDTSYATGNIQLFHPADISQGNTVLVNSSTIFNTFGSAVINGTAFTVWADYGQINNISGPSTVTSTAGKISFYYTATSPGVDTIHVKASIGNATGSSNINVHTSPAISSYTPSSNLAVPSATLNVTFTNPMNTTTITQSNITASYGTISSIQIINQTDISLGLDNLNYNRTVSISFNLKDIYGGVLTQQIQVNTSRITGNIILIPGAWTIDANASTQINSSIIYDSGNHIIQDGVAFYVVTDLGYINTIGSRNATVLTYNGRISFTLIGENQIGTANISVQVNSSAGNASGVLQVQFSDLLAPLQPENVAVSPSTWSPTNIFTITWNNPASLTPINRAYYKFGSAPVSNEDYNGFEEGLNISMLNLSAPTEGRWDVYIWLSDAANNTDYTKHALARIYFDGSPPSILGIELPQITTSQQITATINAQDAFSGIAGYYWRAYKNGTLPPGYTYTSANTCEFTFNAGEGGYTFECYAVDNVGHNSSVSQAFVLYDTGNPYGNITVASKPFTASRNIVVYLNASDNVSGVDKMMLSINDPNFVNSTWIDYKATHNLLLTGGDGKYTIYAKFRDFAGHESAIASDEITLDTTPPFNTSVIIENGAKYTNRTTLTLNITAEDALSGVSGFYLSWVEGVNGTWYPFTQTLSFALSNQSEGLHTLYVKILDNVGNCASLNASIYFDITPPVCNVHAPQYTNSTAITLNLEARDNIGSVRFMRISEHPEALANLTWENYSSLASFVLSEGDGEKTIYIQVCTDLGEQSEVKEVNVVLDTTLPILTILSVDATNSMRLTENTSCNITWNAFDNNGILATTIFMNSSENSWVELARVNTTYYEMNLQDNCTYRVKVRVEDPAGNFREKEFSVIVNINYEPFFVNASIPSEFLTDTVYQFYVNFSDVKNDTLTYTWYINNQLVSSGNMLEYIFKEAGNYTVKVEVSDGKYTVNKTWEISVSQKIVVKGVMDYLPWLLPILLIIVFVVLVIVLMQRKKKEPVSKPSEEGEVAPESPGVSEEAMAEEEEEAETEEREYGITPELEKKIKAYVKQNPGVYLTKLAADFAAEYGMREVDVMTAVQMMEVDGNLTIQVDEEGRTRIYPP